MKSCQGAGKLAIVKDEMSMRLQENYPVIWLATERLIVGLILGCLPASCLQSLILFTSSTLISNFESIPWGDKFSNKFIDYEILFIDNNYVIVLAGEG